MLGAFSASPDPPHRPRTDPPASSTNPKEETDAQLRPKDSQGGRHGGRGHGGPGRRGGHGGETALTGDTAAKVKAAALKKVPGGTVLRVETDAHHGSPYEAHVRKSDGTEVEVLVNKDFEATAVDETRDP